MSMNALPYGTITKVLKQIAREQGKEFNAGTGRTQYGSKCLACASQDRKKQSLSVNDDRNLWQCFYGHGKGGVIHAVLYLHPSVAYDKPSALKWLVDRQLIPSADASAAPDLKTAYSEAVARLCTKDGIRYRSTAVMRNKARRAVGPRFERFPQLEPEPWNEPAEPWVAHSREWREGYAAALSEISALCDMSAARLEASAERSPTITNMIVTRAELLAHQAELPPEPLSERQALAIAWFSRDLLALTDDERWRLPYVEAHAAWLRDPEGTRWSSAWFNPGNAPAHNRRWLVYRHALALAESESDKAWYEIERDIHNDPERQRRLLDWIDASVAA